MMKNVAQREEFEARKCASKVGARGLTHFTGPSESGNANSCRKRWSAHHLDRYDDRHQGVYAMLVRRNVSFLVVLRAVWCVFVSFEEKCLL